MNQPTNCEDLGDQQSSTKEFDGSDQPSLGFALAHPGKAVEVPSSTNSHGDHQMYLMLTAASSQGVQSSGTCHHGQD